MNKRTLTNRQLAIVYLIAERKKKGVDLVSLDEIIETIEHWGMAAHRNSLIVSMFLSNQSTVLWVPKRIGDATSQ